ncbi:protein PHOTOSYSTEM I ASSEMBLY 2, chloroplastic [Andrographis paniculata]|uniref:protein PHOTOSYSTEM I ASSEMBLY 2, chloroplastic n=1 Tax=Andrographis paniculata TaxID=175694 RepID=UPI0021E7FE30|nr:protein PHOTOSYSTEM I ASSEMBLY 2, chloroplastic [Andrographis paniculata]
MQTLHMFVNSITSPAPLIHPRTPEKQEKGRRNLTLHAAKSGSGGLPFKSSMAKRCGTCKGQGAIECPGCKGTGKNKKNGNIFERWKCFECQGFGFKSCPVCGKGGLTPEQRGER